MFVCKTRWHNEKKLLKSKLLRHLCMPRHKRSTSGSRRSTTSTHTDEIVLEEIYINNLKKCTPEVVWKELKETLEEYDDSWNINDDEPCETAHERRWIKRMIEQY